MTLCWVLATAAASWLLQLLYTAGMALVGRRLGIDVEVVSVGYGFCCWERRRGGEVWRFKLLPLGGYVQFRTDEEGGESGVGGPAPGTFGAAPLVGRCLVLLTGPAACLTAGAVLLAVAVLLGRPQLVAETPDGADWPPRIGHAAGPSSPAGQLAFAADTAGGYFARLLTFRPVGEWGGFVALFVTAGRVGRESPVDWVTLVGLMALSQGCLNLLPVPLLNGGHLLFLVAAACLGRPRFAARPPFAWTSLGLLFLLAVVMRLLWLDARWVFGR